jgi:tetratricopeptide (TPR) repeat protein
MPQDRAPIPLKTLKLLFAQSGNRCAFPGCPEKLTYNDDTVLAEICHIQGYSPDSARYNPEMTNQERNSLQNLVLMCAKHHTIIDTHPAEYPKEHLWQIKKDHEAAIASEKSSTSFLTPHQIPPPPDDLIGRDAELDDLIQAHNIGKRIYTIQGMPGVGKSALAYALSEKLAGFYPDGQIFIDLRGASQNPIPAFEAMRMVIRVWKPNEQLPESDVELSKEYQTELSGKKVLLLLDNARERAQVEPLIPPKGNCLLVTSRWEIVLPGRKKCDLHALKPEKAIELLLSIEERLGDDAGKLAELCTYLPLALRLSASAFADQPTCPVEEFLARFTDTQSRLHLTGMDASLQVSYDLLPPDLQTKLRFLSVFPAPFDRPAAAAIWAIDEQTAQTSLDTLVNSSLLDHAESTGFHLHDLVRDFATEKLSSSENYTASFRHASHYLDVARQADVKYQQGGDRVLESLRLFDLYWPHIRQGQAWASANSETHITVARLYSRYPDAVKIYLSLRFPAKMQISWRQAALTMARQLGDKEAESVHLLNMGIAYLLERNVKQAIELFEQALEIDREIGNRKNEGADLGNLGLAFFMLGEDERSLQYYQLALAIAQEIGDRRGEENRLGNLGNTYAKMGQSEKAIENYQQALVISREIGDRQGEGNSFGSLGIIFMDLGKTENAIDNFKQALVIAQEIGDRRGEASRLAHLGNAYFNLGQYKNAIDYHHLSLVINRELGDRYSEINSLRNLGRDFISLGQYDNAIEHYQHALDISRKLGDKSGEGNLLSLLGHACLCNGLVEVAIDHFQQALTIYHELGKRHSEDLELGILGNAYFNLGQFEKAIDYYQQALVIDREIGDRDCEGSHLSNLGNAYHNLGQVDKAIEHYHQALVISREIGDHRGEGANLGNLGNAYLYLGQVDKAIDHHKQALVIDREIGDRRSEGSHLSILGHAYDDLGQLDKAIDYYQEALLIAREIGDRFGEGVHLVNQGSAYGSLGQVDKAIDHYQQALVIAREIGDRCLEGIDLGNLGFAYRNLGQYKKAIEHYRQTLVIYREIGDRRGEGAVLDILALLYEEQDDFVRAVPLASASLAIRQEIKMPPNEIAKMENLLARLREKMGDAAFNAALSGPTEP